MVFSFRQITAETESSRPGEKVSAWRRVVATQVEMVMRREMVVEMEQYELKAALVFYLMSEYVEERKKERRENKVQNDPLLHDAS
jgi:hypothetical protein